MREDGNPETLRYRFAVSLEDPTLRWTEDRVYVPWSPPAVGGSVRLTGPLGIFDP